jgi:hypothetical protein
MKWDMSHPGVKNYNFNISPRNTDGDYCEWLPGTAALNTIIKLKLDSPSSSVIPDNTDHILGDIKITVLLRTKKKDVSDLAEELYKKNQIMKQGVPKAMLKESLVLNKETKKKILEILKEEDEDEKEPNKMEIEAPHRDVEHAK